MEAALELMWDDIQERGYGAWVLRMIV
jgi:hypothetical protein